MKPDLSELDEELGEDEPIEPLAAARAHWSVFLPALIVAALYGLGWLGLDATGRTGGALGRLVFLVLLTAPPLLVAHAFLRFYSAGVTVTRKHILLARGWPRYTAERIPLSDVESVTERRSLMARLVGAGSLHIRLWDGRDVDARDLADPHELVEVIRGRLRVERPY
jgi:uncharacterized membrane protein YdbT with pleckstrin-like domain